jgi:hypothetical protein
MFGDRKGNVHTLLAREQLHKLVESGRHSQWYVGFLPPDRIPSYTCGKCEEVHHNPPKIEVYVSRMVREDSTTTVMYRCTECKEVVHHELLESPEGIPIEYIEFDGTGDWKPPTPEDIEESLRRARETAERGSNYSGHLGQAQYWAEKIGYEISPELAPGLEATRRNAHLRGVERDLPEILERIRGRGYGFSLGSLDDESGYSPFEVSGLYEDVNLLNDALPDIELPDDPELRQEILRILFAHRGMYKTQRGDLVEKRAEIDGEIEDVDGMIGGIESRIRSYLERAGLTQDQIEQARPFDAGA